jgi:hypothetical protein
MMARRRSRFSVLGSRVSVLGSSFCVPRFFSFPVLATSSFPFGAAARLRRLARPQVNGECGRHALRATTESNDRVSAGCRKVPTSLAPAKAAFDLVKLAICDFALVREFLRPETAETLCDITRRGRRRVADLIAKINIARRGSPVDQNEYLLLHLRRKLPRFNLLESSCNHDERLAQGSCRSSGRDLERILTNGERRTQNVERRSADEIALYAV